MVSSKVSCCLQMFPIFSVRNRSRHLGNFPLNTAPDAAFDGFRYRKQFTARKHGSFLNVSCWVARTRRAI